MHVGQDLQVVHVFKNRKTGTSREAHDRGVNEKANAVVTYQHDDDGRLERLLDEGRDIARVGNELDVKPCEARDV